MKRLLVIIFLVMGAPVHAHDALVFRSLEELLDYANEYSITFKNADEQRLLAKKQTLAAKFNMFNFKPTANFSLTDNIEQNIVYIPSEDFGGEPGTYRETTAGQRYVGNFTINPQIDIINPLAIAKVKVSKANIQLTEVNNLVNKKNLYESLGGAFYNILSLQEQIGITNQNIANINSITQLVKNRVQEGIARVQDENLAIINQINANNKLAQLEIQLEQQYDAVKILCDIEPSTSLDIHTNSDSKHTDFKPSLTATGNLQSRQKQTFVNYHKADLGANRLWKLPTLSLFSGYSWQQNSNDYFFDGSDWIDSNYIGLRLSFTLFDFNKIAAPQYSKINLRIAENDLKHTLIQENLDNRQLVLDYQIANEDYQSSLKIEALRKDTFEKNLNLYQEGVLSAKELLDSNNDWLNSHLNVAVLSAAKKYLETKININNEVK